MSLCRKKTLVRLLTLFLAVSSFAVFLSACDIFSKPRPNVMILLLDTLRFDHLSLNGYERDTTPVIDAFSRENLNFTAAVSAAPWTPPSVASILTGLYPASHGMMPPNSRDTARKTSVKLSDSLKTIAEVFQENGYSTGAVTPNPWMKKEFNFNQGFDQYKYFHRVRAEKINEEGIKLLETFTSGEKPFFLYLHYLDPHNPYDPPGRYKEMYKGPLESRQYPEKQVKQMGLYDGEIRYLDTELGKLFDYLKRKELYEDLIIVLVADHGEQFMERGNQGHGFQLFNEEIHVPLVIKNGQGPRSIKKTVSTVDIYPSVLELAGIKYSHPVQGKSLINQKYSENRSVVFSEIKRHYDQKAVVDLEGKKLIADLKEGSYRLFDSRNDKDELTPVEDENLIKKLEAEYNNILKSSADFRKNIEVSEVEIENDTVDELKSLGYL
jgi:arylsulfatase A-like enzyme